MGGVVTLILGTVMEFSLEGLSRTMDNFMIASRSLKPGLSKYETRVPD
jgi:hypothetical protein